jgi:hypothetical protein
MDSRGFLRLRQPKIPIARAAPRGSIRRKRGGAFSARNRVSGMRTEWVDVI